MEQEPKYDFRDGHVFNRANGEMIPEDEPVFVFRARDIHAADILRLYAGRVSDPQHLQAVLARAVQFDQFAHNHPDRMKQPDTDVSDV